MGWISLGIFIVFFVIGFYVGSKTVALIAMCDRCNSMGMASALAGLVFKSEVSDRTVTGETREICPNCFSSFMEWLNTPVDAATKPFRKPYELEASDDD